MTDLPSVDDLLGPAPAKGQLPSVDDVLGPPPQPSPLSGEYWNHFFTNSSVGRVLSAFGHGAAEGFSEQALGFTPENEDGLRKAGIFSDVAKGQAGPIRAFNEALLRPAAVGIDALWRAGGAAFRAAQQGAQTGLTEAGVNPQLARDVAAIPESLMGEAGGHAPEAAPEVPRPFVSPQTFDFLQNARDARVIGHGEDGYFGLTQPANDTSAVRGPAADMPAVEPTPESESAPTSKPGPDIHQIARQVAPDTFEKYDALVKQRDDLRNQIADAINPPETAAKDIELRQSMAQAALDAANPRSPDAARYRKMLADLADEQKALEDRRGAFSAGEARDTPEVSQMRQQLQALDFQMRDLSPDVSAAYREAESRMEAGTEPVARPVEPGPIDTSPESTQTPVEAAREAEAAQAEPTAEEAPTEAAKPPQAEAAPKVQPVPIAQDVASKLLAAGRPEEEANASAALVEAHYQARAARFEGRLGTAEDLYAAEAPTIRSGEKGGRGGNAAGKIRLQQMELAQRGETRSAGFSPRATITLFAKADASTFLHETGHAWLEELLRDAGREEAPADLLHDAKTVRDWLGASDGEAITGRQHEKFARGFERYLMEGRAPTRGLASVFAKFRDWLTSIYQSVAKLNAPITDDIRDVFDRLITNAPEPRETVLANDRPEEFTSSAKRTKDAYDRVPPEPERLVSYLVRRGGLKDIGGDVRQLIGGAKGRPGLINMKRGLHLDEAALQAWEHGYFPEHGENRPTINDLLDKIEADLKLEPQYSAHHAVDVEKYRDALARNEEIGRLSDEHGVSPHSKTQAQFFDEIRAKIGEDAAAAERDNAAEDAAASHGDIEDAGAGDPFGESLLYGLQEDGDGVQQADGGTDPAERSGGSQQPIRAPGDEGTGQGDAGQGASGAGAGRRDTAGESSTASAGRERSPELVDQQGNIRLENLFSAEDVIAAVRAQAEQHGYYDTARRGVVSDKETADLANAVNATSADLNLKILRQRYLEDGIAPEARVMALRQEMRRQGERVRAAELNAMDGSDADVMAYAAELDRMNLIQETLAAVTAGSGRVQRAFRNISPESLDAQQIAELAKQSTGRTLFQLREQAKQQFALRLGDDAQLAKFARDQAKPSVGDMVFEYWVNGLISGPATHTTYAVGNLLMATWKAVPETAIAAATGSIREAIKGEPVERVYWGEVGAQLSGMFQGVQDGMQAAWQAAKTGDTTKLPGEKVSAFAMGQGGAIPGTLGEVARLPSRMVATIHSFFRATGYSQAKFALSYRQAMAEGLTGDAFDARVADLRQSPTPELMKQARDQATEQTLMGAPGPFTRAVTRTLYAARVKGVPVGRFIAPFVTIGSNILHEGLLKRTPLGILSSDIRDNLAGRNGNLARDTQIARIAAGSAIGIFGLSLAAQGLITGGGPSDPKERAAWLGTGKMPYSVKIGSTWYSYARLGVLAKPLALTADLYELGEAATEKDASHIAGMITLSFSRVVMDESWMRGPASMLEAINDPKGKGARWASDEAASFLPFSVGMSQIARAIDPYARQARTTIDTIKSRVPFLSQSLLPRVDVWGQQVPNKDVVGPDGLSAIYASRVNNDPTVQRVAQLGAWPSMPERQIRGTKLTDQQYQDYAVTAGQMTKARLDALVNTPGFQTLPDGVQAQTIRQTIENARETARSIMLMKNPEIVQQAMERKSALLKGTP